MRTRKTIRALATAVPILLAPLDAQAVVKTWIANSGNWSVNGNWSPFGRPADFDDISMFGANGFSKTVTYDIDDGLLHVYGTIGIQSAGFGTYELRQPATSLEALHMSVAGTPQVNGRARHVLSGGGTAFVGSTFLGDLGTVSLAGGSAYHVGSFTHDGGTVSVDSTSTFTVSGTYRFEGGSVTGPMRIAGTGGLEVNGATFGGAVDNFGSLAINTNTHFTDNLINRAPFTILGPRVITAERWDQRGGTITQFGETRGGFYWVQGGATWNLMGGIHTQATQIAVGHTAGDGTYAMAGGSVNMNGFTTARIIVGMNNAGSFLQSGGDVRVPFLSVGGAGTLGSGRGLYRLSGGSLLVTGQMVVGTHDALGGVFEQTGGAVELARLIVNQNETGDGLVHLAGGTMLINSTSTNNGTWSQTGGRAFIDGFLDGTGSVSVTGNGSLTLSRLRQKSLFVGGDARVVNQDISITNQVNRVESLAFEEGPAGTVRGTWDLDNTLLAIDYTGPSPINDVKRYLASGYANGSWTGTGLSSTLMGIFQLAEGYAEASDVLGPAGGMFGGELVDGSTVLVKFTRYGDANLDGTVNLDDFNRLAANFGGTNKIWSQGDFNYDGRVNLDDFNVLASNFGLSASPGGPTPDDWAALASAVPEPLAPALLSALGAWAATSRRRSRPGRAHCS